MASLSLEKNKANTSIFELLPGQLLDVQFEQLSGVRLKLPLIGYAFGQYIMLKFPVGIRTHDYHDALSEGKSVFIRYLVSAHDSADAQGECFSFDSTIKSIMHSPEKCLVIEYPLHIYNRQLRRYPRTQAHLPAKLKFIGTELLSLLPEFQGVVVDISPRGCGFSFSTAEQLSNLRNQELTLKVQSPIEGEIAITARVCNQRFENEKMTLGMQFIADSVKVERLLVHLFIECL
ncbi:MAG: flagellar brake protein [Colwellia sp.]|nr:flagellar brake protein [Colwellia sp.]